MSSYYLIVKDVTNFVMYTDSIRYSSKEEAIKAVREQIINTVVKGESPLRSGIVEVRV